MSASKETVNGISQRQPMNLNPAISVIIPVYNAGSYLHRCVGSMLAQTFSDFEILLIDDGSTDGSSSVCDTYASQDPRIKVLHQKNGGVASARRTGIAKAKGTYSIHADADDYAEPNMLQEMYDRVTETGVDMLVADFYLDYANGIQRKSCQSASGYTSSAYLKAILMGKRMGTLWNKLIRHSLYNEFQVQIEDGIDYCEDVLVLTQLLQYGIEIDSIEAAYYHYNLDNNSSITRNYSKDTYNMKKRYHHQLSAYLNHANWGG